MAELTDTDLREQVRERYAAAAKAPDGAASCGCCSGVSTADPEGREVFGGALYDREADAAPQAAVQASLGCGVPTAVADLHAGETVLDLGSGAGAGADVFISARRVGPTGKAIGVDMTNEMLELARRNAAEARVTSVEFVKGYLEDLPLADGSVDVVISNCVINLAADKRKVIAEAARVLHAGGRVTVSDVIADPDMDETTRADIQQWTGCVAGALTETELRAALTDAGLTDIEVQPTHRVHQHASSATIHARKPTADGCCEPQTLTRAANPQPRTTAAASPPTPPSHRRAAAARGNHGHPRLRLLLHDRWMSGHARRASGVGRRAEA